mgnify:CR=1 FL=1
MQVKNKRNAGGAGQIHEFTQKPVHIGHYKGISKHECGKALKMAYETQEKVVSIKFLNRRFGETPYVLSMMHLRTRGNLPCGRCLGFYAHFAGVFAGSRRVMLNNRYRDRILNNDSLSATMTTVEWSYRGSIHASETCVLLVCKMLAIKGC